MNPTKFNPFPTIVTERLTLRKFSPDDREIIFALRSDPRVMKYIKRPLAVKIEDADAHIARINAFADEGRSIAWSICLNETGACVGTICLWNFSEDETQAEAGYDLIPDFHGKGIMSEALKAVVGYGFNTLHLKTIEAYTNKNNAKSIALLEGKGFIHQPGVIDEGNSENAIYALYNPVKNIKTQL